jgi:hypothetical protein
VSLPSGFPCSAIFLCCCTMTPLMPVAGKELITRGTSEVIQKLEVAVPVTIDLLSEQHIIFIHDLCRVRCPPPSSFHLDLR